MQFGLTRSLRVLPCLLVALTVQSGAAARLRSSGASAQQLWQDAWLTALEQMNLDGANTDGMPPELVASIQERAEKIWKSLLARRHISRTTTADDFTTTTVNFALRTLLAGVEPGMPADTGHDMPETVPETQARASTTQTTTTTTTTTTEDPQVEVERQQAAMLQQEAQRKLMQGMNDANDEKEGDDDESENKKVEGAKISRRKRRHKSTTTTTEEVPTTTTPNEALLKLLAGVDPSVPDVQQQAVPATTTTATVASTTTTTRARRTTTTEDAQVVRDRQKASMLQAEARSRLTQGMASTKEEIAEEAREATATTTTTAAPTTTQNAMMKKLLANMDGSQPVVKVTTTTTTTMDSSAAMLKSLIGLRGTIHLKGSAGSFDFHTQNAALLETPNADDDDDKDDDQDKKTEEDPTVSGEASEVAADFDADNMS